MTTLQLDNLKVQIDKGSLVSFLANDHEYIHQVGSPGWGKSDDEMFPIIGPTDEAGFKVKTPKGEAILDQHGLLRELDYTCIEATETRAVFQKTYTANTPVKNSKYPKKSSEEWLSWPYDFRFQKQFNLKQDELEIEFIITGPEGMPFMLGYHPAFKLHSQNPVVSTSKQEIPLKDILAVGSRAYEVADCSEITLKDSKTLRINSQGFENFMLWTEVTNMLCIEPVSFYPYAVEQKNLDKGFRQLINEPARFKVSLSV